MNEPLRKLELKGKSGAATGSKELRRLKIKPVEPLFFGNSPTKFPKDSWDLGIFAYIYHKPKDPCMVYVYLPT